MVDKICSKCGRTMSYDPYFNKMVCRQCGNFDGVEEENNRDDIKEIKNAIKRFKICLNVCDDCMTCGEHDEALEVALEALEKQIPKKAVNVNYKRDFNGSIIVKRGNCPICNDEVNNVYNYCIECGQKIDWSE